MKNSHSYKKGFTYIEIIVSLGILILLGFMGVSTFSSWQKKEALNSTWQEGLSLLEEARSKTLSSENSSSYGVHFESDKMISFKAPYVSGNLENKEIFLNSFVSVSGISLNGGGSEVVFKRLSGETDNYGSITISQKTDSSNFKIIEVQQTGTAK